MAENTTRAELKAKMDRGDGFVLVDALGPEHFESSHLPGAINLPHESVDEAEGVLPDRNTKIVVYCMSAGCSASGEARELEAMGYANVRHHVEGKLGPVRAVLPVEGVRKRHLA